jgi:hypothetical protein
MHDIIHMHDIRSMTDFFTFYFFLLFRPSASLLAESKKDQAQGQLVLCRDLFLDFNRCSLR